METYATLAAEGYPPTLDALAGDLEVFVHLYTNDPPLSDVLTTADMVEPVFAGYVAQPAYRWTPSAPRDSVAFTTADPAWWRWTSGPAPDPIRGCYATVGPDGPLLWVWRRPGDPYALGPSHPLLTVMLTMRYPVPCPP